MLGRSFVRADLQRVNRTRTPWVIVNGHRPMYPSSMFGQHHSSDLTVAQDLRSAFEELCLQHQARICWVHGCAGLSRVLGTACGGVSHGHKTYQWAVQRQLSLQRRFRGAGAAQRLQGDVRAAPGAQLLGLEDAGSEAGREVPRGCM